MHHWKLVLLCSVAVLAACKSEEKPTQWSDIEGVPDGFKDGQDDVRRDEEIRAVAYDEPTEVAEALKGRFVSAEADPVYAASVASHISQEEVAAWNAQVAAGDHRNAGYLTAETDPKFAASVASTVTTTQVTNWNTAFSWGNHAKAGYLTTESDPQIGALTTGSVPVWTGTSLENGTLREVNGKVGVGTSTPSALLTVSTYAKFGAGLPTATTKSCSFSGFNWTNTPPSNTACAAYCTSLNLGFVGGAVSAQGSKRCGGASCDYISDFGTCTVASMQNNGSCDSCASSFVCTCLEAGNELTGKVRMMNGNVGIGVALPNSPLHVSGYLQLGTTAGAPPTVDCDEVTERGRMLMDPATGSLWVCANSGWLSK